MLRGWPYTSNACGGGCTRTVGRSDSVNATEPVVLDSASDVRLRLVPLRDAGKGAESGG